MLHCAFTLHAHVGTDLIAWERQAAHVRQRVLYTMRDEQHVLVCARLLGQGQRQTQSGFRVGGADVLCTDPSCMSVCTSFTGALRTLTGNAVRVWRPVRVGGNIISGLSRWQSLDVLVRLRSCTQPHRPAT